MIALFGIYKNKNALSTWNFKTNKNRKQTIPISTKILLIHKSINSLNVLLVKEYILLFKYKITIFLQPFLYLYTMFTIFDPTYLYILISFFIVDFGFYYGSNYFGLEDYPFIYTIQAPFDKKYLFRSKHLMLLILSLLGTGINIIVFSIFVNIGLYDLLQMIVTAFFTISIVLFIAPILSTCFFNTSYSKKKYVVQNVFIMLGLVLITIVFSTIAFANKSLTILCIVFTFIISIASIYFSIVNPFLYTNLLEKRKERILAILREK